MIQALRLLPALFMFVGAATFFDQFVNDRLQGLAKGRDIFVTAMGHTRARLVNGAWQALSDASIQQNFEWNNLNTVGQTMQNYLRAGEVSQMELLDHDCTLLTRVPQSEKPILSGCDRQARLHPQLTWRRDGDQTPMLTVSIPKIIAGKSVLLVAHVLLDQAWLSAHPELFSLIHHHEFNLFEPSSRGMIWRDQTDALGEPLLTMRVAGWISGVMPNFMRYSLESRPGSFWFFYMILGAFIVVALIQQTMLVRNDADQRLQWLNWLKERQTASVFRNLNLKAADGKDWHCIATQLKAMIDRVTDQKQLEVKLLRERQEQMSLGSIQRDREIADLQERLSGMADLASLKEQLQHSTQTFLAKMEDTRELCEDMFDVASEGLARHSKELHEFHTRWKRGVEDESHRERGARKFFRALSETVGSRPGSTLLDDELTRLGELTGAALDQSLHLAMMARQALAEMESGVQVAALWHGLSMRDGNPRTKTSDWVECLIVAQKLVSADTRYGTLSFERLPVLGTPEETYPPVARVALVSGFFHLYMALLSDVTVNAISLPLVLRQKRFADHGTIILSLPQPAADVADAAPGRSQSYHLELAKGILGPLGVRVAFLPPTVAGVPVAMTWTLPGKQVDVVAGSVSVNEKAAPTLDLTV